MVDDGVFRVPGHVEHLHLRTDRSQALRELGPAHLRHDDVGEQEMDRSLVLLAEKQGFVAVPGLEDVVAVPQEDRAGDDPELLLIFDEEHRLGPADRGHLDRGFHLQAGLVRARQVDLERRSLPELAVDPDVAAALLNDSEYGRQSQPRALALLFRGEEGLENALLGRFVHAGSGIADRQHHVWPRRDPEVLFGIAGIELDVLRLDGEVPPAGHGVAGIDHQVHQHLLQVPRVGLHLPEVLPRHRPDRDVLADQAANHLVHAGDDLVEVENARLQDLLPAEGQELPGQLRGAFPRLLDLFDVRAHRIGRWHPADEDARVAQDHRQEVVEVVRDPAGQPTDGLHLLGVTELLFASSERRRRALSVGDVEGEDARPLGYRDEPQLEPALRPVGKGELVLQLEVLALRQAPPEHREHRRRVDPRIAFHHRSSEERFSRLARLGRDGVVDVQVLPVETDDLATLHQAVEDVACDRVGRRFP